MYRKYYLKVTTDMFWMQFFWALSFLGVMLLIHVIKIIASMFNEDDVSTFFALSSIASNIFMLVIGIISSFGFIKYYVGHGITRKDYFYGAAAASVGLSIILPMISALITYMVSFIINFANLSIVWEAYKNENIDHGGNIIVDIVQSIVLTPIIELQSNPILALFIFSVSILTYYIVGWLIGATFYRFGTIAGIGSIVLGILVIYIEEILMNSGLGFAIYHYTYNLPLYLSVLVLLVILGIVLWIIRQVTKRVAIKI
ncbi:hypothetical protein [Cytobacillus purgationiresistens]|uniref:ABC transporter permease n=1 Tax=Cytobacillus purgationiresistens TaxID=863449 RepID=A0ABU0ABL1_9BACI|nr:hypothetical protein [Cytobacillus purgationiresistens]MDQ0268637.1 hypothetical protein [Cytobacillus purgationiresistens]